MKRNLSILGGVAVAVASVILAAGPASASPFIDTPSTPTGCWGRLELAYPNWGYGSAHSGNVTCTFTISQHNLQTYGQQNWSMTIPPGGYGESPLFYRGDGVHQLDVCVDDGTSFYCTGWYN